MSMGGRIMSRIDKIEENAISDDLRERIDELENHTEDDSKHVTAEEKERIDKSVTSVNGQAPDEPWRCRHYKSISSCI